MTRLVFRADVPVDLLDVLIPHERISRYIETAYVRPDNPEMVHLFLGYNKEERLLSSEMLEYVRIDLSSLLEANTFQSEVLLGKVNTMIEQDYTFSTSPTEDQLRMLR